MIPVGLRGLHGRITLLVVSGVLAATAVLGWASWSGVQALRVQVLADRAALAERTARHVEDLLRADLEVLQQAALAGQMMARDADPSLERAALKDAYLRSHLLEAVHLVHGDGTLLWSEPPRLDALPVVFAPGSLLAEALRAGRPAVSGLVSGLASNRSVYMVVPTSPRAAVRGAVVGELDPRGPRFVALAATLGPADRLEADLVDQQGLILASTDRTRLFLASDTAALGTRALSTGQPVVSAPWQAGSLARREVIAAAPVGIVAWVVVIRQPAHEALSGEEAMRDRLLIAIPALLAGAVLFAWGAARSVRRPLAILTSAAERIAAGTLSQPIPALGDDEVGRLGRSFDTMRVALEESLARIERANEELERRVEERTRELETLYQQLRERDQVRGRLLNKLISAQEDERKRIARELHDETSQTLSALVLRLDSAAAAGVSPIAVQDARSLAVRTLDEIHRIIHDLRPSVLDDLGLISAIRWYATRTLAPHGISVRCEFGGLDRRFPPEIETTLFRILQEAMTNIARHARAETVLIEAAVKDNVLTIEIEDDGVGFDPAAQGTVDVQGRGVGLMGMRERVELLGGTVRIDSAPGRGTRVILTVPLSGQETPCPGSAS